MKLSIKLFVVLFFSACFIGNSFSMQGQGFRKLLSDFRLIITNPLGARDISDPSVSSAVRDADVEQPQQEPMGYVFLNLARAIYGYIVQPAERAPLGEEMGGMPGLGGEAGRVNFRPTVSEPQSNVRTLINYVVLPLMCIYSPTQAPFALGAYGIAQGAMQIGHAVGDLRRLVTFTGDRVNDAAGVIVGRVNDAAHVVNTRVNDAAHVVNTRVDRVAEVATNRIDRVAGVATDGLQRVITRADRVAEVATNRINEVSGTVTKAVDDIVGDATKLLTEVKNSVEDVRSSFGVAAKAIGFGTAVTASSISLRSLVKTYGQFKEIRDGKREVLSKKEFAEKAKEERERKKRELEHKKRLEAIQQLQEFKDEMKKLHIAMSALPEGEEKNLLHKRIIQAEQEAVKRSLDILVPVEKQGFLARLFGRKQKAAVPVQNNSIQVVLQDVMPVNNIV